MIKLLKFTDECDSGKFQNRSVFDEVMILVKYFNGSYCNINVHIILVYGTAYGTSRSRCIQASYMVLCVLVSARM